LRFSVLRFRYYSRLHAAQQLLDKAKKAAQHDVSKDTIEAVQIILTELVEKERKESDARMAPNAVRKASTIG
jgi:hypothetical protein